MKKLCVLAASLLMSFAVHAFSDVVCPDSLSCDGNTGTCNAPLGWDVYRNDTHEQVPGKQDLHLSAINAWKVAGQQAYYFVCSYRYGNHYAYVKLATYVNELIGSNWIFSGSDNRYAQCASVTEPGVCTGKK